MRTRCAVVILLAALAVPAAARQGPRPAGPEPSILRVMWEEMARSMAGLRMKDEPPPYYIAYTVEDTTSSLLQATLGATVEDQTSRARALHVDVRVGDYTFDSSRFWGFDQQFGGEGGIVYALDDNEDVMRRQIWLATDAAYKRAVSAFSKKKAAFQNRAQTDPAPDFSKERPLETILPSIGPSLAGTESAENLRQISAVFLAHPSIQSSRVALTVRQGTRYFLNSEGFKTVAPVRLASLGVVAETQADDGLPLWDGFMEVSQAPTDLPPLADLVRRARELASSLVVLRSAASGEDYTGPVLIEGEAAGELLLQTFVPLFLSLRAPESDEPGLAGAFQFPSSAFLSRIGGRVMPESFSVRDTPSLTEYGGAPAVGAYMVDEEGVPAQDVGLVQDGRLRTLLTSRTPQKNLLQSNGHARGGSAQAGVFQVETSRGVPASQLKEKYLDLLKQQSRPFGIIIRRVASPAVLALLDDSLLLSPAMLGGSGLRGGPTILRAVKVTPEGKEESVRNVVLGEVTRTTYRDILEASEERLLYNTVASRVSLVTGSMFSVLPARSPEGRPVSLIVPSLVFDELEIQKSKAIPQKPPIVPSPLK